MAPRTRVLTTVHLVDRSAEFACAQVRYIVWLVWYKGCDLVTVAGHGCYTQAAFAAGLSPEVIYYNATEGVMLTRAIVGGRTLTSSDMHAPDMMDEIATLLAQFHTRMKCDACHCWSCVCVLTRFPCVLVAVLSLIALPTPRCTVLATISSERRSWASRFQRMPNLCSNAPRKLSVLWKRPCSTPRMVTRQAHCIGALLCVRLGWRGRYCALTGCRRDCQRLGAC